MPESATISVVAEQQFTIYSHCYNKTIKSTSHSPACLPLSSHTHMMFTNYFPIPMASSHTGLPSLRSTYSILRPKPKCCCFNMAILQVVESCGSFLLNQYLWSQGLDIFLLLTGEDIFFQAASDSQGRYWWNISGAAQKKRPDSVLHFNESPPYTNLCVQWAVIITN